MRFAYADPPYLGQARKHYGPEAREVNHPLLIAHLQEFDGWALSLSAPSLRTILPMVPEDARVCAWVKPFAAFKKNVTQAYAWEPVIVKPLRRRPVEEPTVRDWVSVPITLRRGVSGAKPEGFCRWLFDFAGLEADDELVDLFPGSGAVGQAWESWRSQARFNDAPFGLPSYMTTNFDPPAPDGPRPRIGTPLSFSPPTAGREAEPTDEPSVA